jgi:hypothetical protein
MAVLTNVSEEVGLAGLGQLLGEVSGRFRRRAQMQLLALAVAKWCFGISRLHAHTGPAKPVLEHMNLIYTGISQRDHTRNEAKLNSLTFGTACMCTKWEFSVDPESWSKRAISRKGTWCFPWPAIVPCSFQWTSAARIRCQRVLSTPCVQDFILAGTNFLLGVHAWIISLIR